MEVKVAGRQFQRVASRQAGDLKRALDRRTKVKVSALLSPEGQKAILMVREESCADRKPTQENPAMPTVMTSIPEPSYDDQSPCTSDDVIVADHVGFGALLERICTTRLYGDITDKNFTPRLSRKRALRAGDRLHTAMEVVEIVRHDCDDDNEHYDDSDDEQEAMQRAADLISQQRCQAWVELHFDQDGDDVCSVSSAER
ncbi:hypothetical protein ACOMHN_055634 [Nucella lapillus]